MNNDVARLEARNVLLLTCAQALFQTASIMLVTLSGLIGLRLAPDKGLATLPIAVMVVSGALTMMPASMWMHRRGRRHGFLTGAMLGCLAGLAGLAAIVWESFGFFMLANMLVGAYQGFAQYYRFAAAEAASDAYRSRAISWVMTGGVVAAIAGPALARFTSDVGPKPFMASFMAMVLLAMVAGALISRLSLPPVPVDAAAGPARRLAEIARQPVFLAALISSAAAFSVMVMVMTATPLAMQTCGHNLGAAASVIQGHVLGMFVPSFFTGHLIRRIGTLPVIALGMLLLGAQVAIALSGIAFMHFLSGLILLGVGWNFMFIGATTLVMQAYRPSERAKTQGVYDFITFGTASVASFSAGSLLDAWGWRAVNLSALPMLGIAALALAAYGWRTRAGALTASAAA
jgi:predicted MFS family arabinose efflux permease